MFREVYELFHIRDTLFRNAYQHKTKRAVEIMWEECNINYIVYYVYLTAFTAVYTYVGNYVLKEYNYIVYIAKMNIEHTYICKILWLQLNYYHSKVTVVVYLIIKNV